MRLNKTLGVAIVAMAMFVAVSAAGQPKDSKALLLHYDATVAGSHLASGDYRVQVETHSPAATVSFLQKGKVVATVEATLVDRGSKYEANQVVCTADSSGAREIQEIRFRGSSQVIVFK